MKEIKDAYQTMNNKSLRTEETSDMNNPVEIKLEEAETQDAVVGEAAAIDVESAVEELESAATDFDHVAEEPESAVDVQEFTELTTDQLQPIELAFDEVAVEAPKDERVIVKPAKTKSVEMEDVVDPHTVVVEVVEPAAEDALCPEFNEEEVAAATVEMEATDEETTVSDDVKEDLSADAAAKLASTQSEVVVAEVNGEVNGEVKAASDSTDKKFSTDKEGVSNEGLAAFATDEEPADKRLPVDTCEEVASVVEVGAIKAVAEEEGTETTTSEAKSLDEAEPVTQDMDLSVEGIAIEPTVEEAVAEAVADSETDDKAFSAELEVSAEGDSEKEGVEVTKNDDEELEEANTVQELEVADKEAEAPDNKADIAVESSATMETTRDDDTPAHRFTESIVEKVEAEEVSVVEIDEATRTETETETAPINEDGEVLVEEAKTDTASFDERTEVVVSELETVAAAPSAEIDEAVVKVTASYTETANVAVEEADTETVPVAETNEEVLLEKSENVEVEAVETDFVAEKVEDAEQSVDKMPKEAPAVAAVDTAPAIAKVSDDEAASVKQTPAFKVASADDTPVGVNLTVSTISEYDENESSKSSDNFEMDTKPIRAVSTLIGRFEHIAKRNATEAASSRTSSRTSSRVSSPLPSPPSSWSRGKGSETVVKSNKAIENSGGPVHVESNNKDVLTEVEADKEAAEVEKTAKVVESVDESSEFEETPSKDDVCEEATTLNDAETVAHENTLAATDVDGAARESFVVEAPAAVDTEESTLEAEAANKTSDAIEEVPVAELTVVEQESIDESTEAEVEVEKTLAVETELAEIIAEPEAEDVDLESTAEEETPRTAKGADAIASEATEAYEVVEKVPVAVVTTVDMAEADVETSEPETILAAYKPAEASILSIDGPKVDAAWNEAVEDVQEDAEDAAPSATSLVDVEEAVDTADFTTDESIDDFVPVTNQNEEDSSEFVSAMKETQAMYEEITESQVEGGKQEEMSESMEREMPLTSPPAPGVRPDNGALAYEGTTKASVVMAPSNEATKAATDDAMEKTPERNSLQIPYEQLTYEILGVTRANNVIMYHIYAINNATGEQAMSIPKRYSEFKVLDEQLRALYVPSALGLPVLPKPGVVSFLRGRRSQKTIEMREKAFGDFLHYVREHEDLHKSTVFQQFIAN